ncbi:hypothetical protein HPB51_014613 [Rhipicephalus microplus]|uniref:REKLES domain-containing protein n=1 Tax=Rhipicephalus microplus TaxID=6941 RepID=A0A9J6F434_RHIMP|nr:hypothetical protein HPB51_014613 [Rhipicephalus microplus]
MDTVTAVRGRGTTRRELLSASGDGVRLIQSARAALSSEIAGGTTGRHEVQRSSATQDTKNTVGFKPRYMKYLYPYECEKEKLSQPDELQAAIDGNRREGRRSSYSHYAEMMSTAATAASLSASRGSNHHTSPISLVCRQANGHAPSSAHHPAGGPSSGDEENSLSLYVPQQEALNLEVPRGGSADHKVIDPRRLLSESLGPPPPKRFIPSDEDHLLAQSMHTTHIKMNSRGDGRGQADNSMTVTMEVNGIIYHGVLYPQTHRNRLS